MSIHQFKRLTWQTYFFFYQKLNVLKPCRTTSYGICFNQCANTHIFYIGNTRNHQKFENNKLPVNNLCNRFYRMFFSSTKQDIPCIFWIYSCKYTRDTTAWYYRRCWPVVTTGNFDFLLSWVCPGCICPGCGRSMSSGGWRGRYVGMIKQSSDKLIKTNFTITISIKFVKQIM